MKHNLPERETCSVPSCKNTVDKRRAALGKLDANLEKLTTSSCLFEILIEALDSEEAGFDRVEKVMSEQVLRAPDFRSVSSRALDSAVAYKLYKRCTSPKSTDRRF